MPTSARVLLFSLAEHAWAIPLERVAAIGRCERLCPVPGAPPFVLGLTERQATTFVVLDCARLVGERPRPGDACLVVLAAPFERTALFISSRVDLARVEAHDRASSSVTANGVSARWADPLAMLRDVEDALRER